MAKSKSISTPSVSSKKNGAPVKSAKVVSSKKSSSNQPTTIVKTSIITSEDPSELPLPDSEADQDQDDEDSSGSSSDEHEEGRDVSERGLKRLMEALGKDGLDDFDSALLEGEGDQDELDDYNEELDEEAMEGLEGGSNDEEEEPELPSKKTKTSSKSNDSLAASILRSGLVPERESDEEEDEEEEEEDPEAEDGDSGSDNEDLLTSNPNDDSTTTHSRKKGKGEPKKYINNEEAMLRIYEDIRIAGPSTGKGKGVEMPWIEHMALTHDQDLGIEDAENDLERELAFYKQSLASTIQAQKRYSTLNVPFSRPNDFFAEMVKTDEHMERVRQRLLDERAGIKASEEAKRQRELKKFGKKVQVEKGLERQREKKRMEESVKGLKRKRQGGLEGDGGEDDFDIRLAAGLEEDSNDRSSTSRGRGRGRGKDGRAKMPRNSRDAKYGFGGSKRHSKENTSESTGDFGREKSGRGGRGGRGGSRGGSRGSRGGSRGSSRGSSSRGRPGKSKRS